MKLGQFQNFNHKIYSVNFGAFFPGKSLTLQQ